MVKLREVWRNIACFPGYQVSSFGRIRSFWKRKHYPTGYGTYWYLSDEPTLMKLSDDGNGYLKVMLYCRLDGKRYCKKVHRLVAEAFIPHEEWKDTVDHIQSGRDGKLNNRVDNLRWIPRYENIRKAYADGMCDERINGQKKPIMATDILTGDVEYFASIGEASDVLGIERSSISHVLRKDHRTAKHYHFEYLESGDYRYE